ncbi:MAG: SDR family NAD(P)-dependent oxidoreductase [Thermoleophilaceae bacterium]
MDIGPGTRALVTGASRGIGAALAEALAARGATVGLAARSEDELRARAGGLPGQHHALPCDVGDRQRVVAAVERFISEAGGLELAIANAGVASYGPFAEQDPDEFERMTRINWLGTVHTVSAVLPHMLERAKGHIVVVSSASGLRTFPGAAVYGATKAAQRGFAEALRHELSGSGVSLTVAFPGEMATHLHDHEKETLPGWYRGGSHAPPPTELAQQILTAVQRDRRHVHHPPIVRLLGAVHGISPRAADLLLRRLRGASAAPAD